MAVTVLLLAGTMQAAAANLLLNGSFERNVDQDTFPEHWEFLNYAPDGTVEWAEDQTAPDGRIVLHMAVPKDGQVILKPGGISNDEIPAVAGRTYVLSAYARTADAVKTNVQVGGIYADGQHRWDAGSGWIVTDGATPWKRYTWKFTAPAGIRAFWPWISHQKGTLWVDAFQLEEAPEATPYGAPEFARIYVEPAAGRHVYPTGRRFTPSYTVYNETADPIQAKLAVGIERLWTEDKWTLEPQALDLPPHGAATVKIGGAPKDLPAGRYRLTFTGTDTNGRTCCGMKVDQTLAGPPGAPIPRLAPPEPPLKPKLQSVADTYSRLLVAESLAAEKARQLDRLLFHAGQARENDTQKAATAALRSSQEQIVKRLQAVRTAYNQAYAMSFKEHHQAKTLTDAEKTARDALLATAVNDLQTLERDIPASDAALTARVGALTAEFAGRIQPGFRPASVGHIGRAQQELTLDSTGRANGIIWGICGQPPNALRVQRWFGFGSLLGKTPGMRGTGTLAQGPQTWFNQGEYREFQREGLKYDASFGICVGTMTNAAATKYFLDAQKNDPDLFLQTSTGQIPNRSALNPWHPAVRDQIRDFCTTQARLLHDDPRAIYHYYAWEPSFSMGGKKEQGGMETGYNPTAKADFRRHLQAKFGSVGKLNAAWGSDYASFAAIEPPPDGLVVPRTKATPLTYEFEVWRRRSYADFYELCYKAIKAGDPSRPVGISGEGSASYFNSNSYADGIDYWQLARRSMDFLESHSELYLKLPDIIWEHSFARLLNKPQLLNESNWDFSAPSHEQNERQWQATGEISLWRWIVWGRSYINLMSAESEYVPPTKFYGQSLLEMKQDYTILRECAAFLKPAMEKSERYGDILLSSRVATPRLAVLQPSTSAIDCFPTGGLTGGFPHHPPRQEAFNFSALNLPKNYDYLYVPEEAVLEDHHDLRQYRAVLLPYATHFPTGLTEALLAYVRDGGWLICAAPPGVYDAYGRTDNRLLTAVLGPCDPRYVSGGENTWVWTVGLKQMPAAATVELADGKEPVILSAPYGKGGLVLTLAGWRTAAAKQVYYRLMDRAIGRRTAWCGQDRFELVTRIDRQGRRYLFVVNPSVDQVADDEISLDGTFARPVDIGIGQGFPVPARVADGVTAFRLHLEPGDSTAIELR